MTFRGRPAGRRIGSSPFLAGALAVLFIGGGVRAGGLDADPAAGRLIGERLCSRCHAVGPSGDSPLAAAPPFRILGRSFPVDNLAEALAEGIVTGHRQMPQFELTPAQVGDFLAWLRVIQTP